MGRFAARIQKVQWERLTAPLAPEGSREALIKSLSAFILEFLCNARNEKGNSELFKESHDEAVHKNFYKSKLYELISASLKVLRFDAACGCEGCGGGCRRNL